MHRFLAGAVALLFVAGLSSAAAVGGRVVAAGTSPRRPFADTPTRAAPPAPPALAAPIPTTVATTVPASAAPHPAGPAALAGCPPPPPPPGPRPPPWHPAVLVPEGALPAPAPPSPRTAALDPVDGKGMWLWQFGATENGNADAIISRAGAAGLRQLWVRVGDSQSGFYGATVLDELVWRAHRRGIAVMGWGFPYLYDPMADARWTAQALTWQGPRGERLDGFSPDLETASEGVMVTERRLEVYLGQLDASAPGRPLVATVFRPTDRMWAWYPYRAIAPYVDAFAPMVYWGCTEPGAAAAEAIARLAALRPVHLIGQGYNMAADGGRRVAPSADETWRFLDVARRGGALGASFWSWQEISQEQWASMAGFAWPLGPQSHRSS